MSMHNILAKLASLVKTEEPKQEANVVKDEITEATAQLEEKYQAWKKLNEKAEDWEPEDEPRKPTKQELETDKELKAAGKKTADTLKKISSAFSKKHKEEFGEEVDMGQADARKTQPSSEEEADAVFAKHFKRMKDLRNELDDADKKDVAEGTINENLRLVSKVQAGNKLAKIYKDSDWDEYRVKFYTDGKYDGEDSDHHTDDKEDAVNTAKFQITNKHSHTVAEGKIDDLNDRRAAKSNDEEWTTGTGGKAVRKGHITTHTAGKGVYGGSKPHKHGEYDDEEENNNDKKEAEPTAPKKRGRPKKVREAALREKAVSRAQQQAAAIAMHAPKSELKGASKEMAKMPKKELEKFAGTKHKGLPKHVKEAREQITESLAAIARHYGKEMRDFATTGNLDEDLYDALYDYYIDDMPYGVKKARTDDPYSWISDKLHAAIQSGEVEIKESNLTEPAANDVVIEEPDTNMTPNNNFDDLNELARLAGLSVAEAKSCNSKRMNEEDVEEGNEFTKALADAKAAGKEEFTVGGKTYKVQESVNMTECGEMSPMGSGPEQDNLSINASYNSMDNRKTVTVTAEGDKADALMQMLKLAGMVPGAEDEHSGTQIIAVGPQEAVEVSEEDEEVAYSNSPDEQYQGVDAIIHQGNDLNREKKQYASKPKLGDNPMAEDILALESKLAAEYESIKKAAK